jgi:hypothetical protein
MFEMYLLQINIFDHLFLIFDHCESSAPFRKQYNKCIGIEYQYKWKISLHNIYTLL